MHSMLPVAAAVSIVVTAAANAEPSYYPLHVGNTWTYSAPSGAFDVLTVVGTRMPWGREVFVVRYGPSTENDGLENYWSVTPEGHVLLSGFYRDDSGSGWLYDPPVLMLEAPLTLSSSWSTDFTIYSLPETTLVGSSHIAFRVYEEGDLTVPAGTFYAYGVGQTVGPSFLSSSGLSLTGERVDEASAQGATDWWADGVGEAQYGTSELFKLDSYHAPTPVMSRTWGALKSGALRSAQQRR